MEVNRKQLQEALSDAFTDIASFSQLLTDMGRSWDALAGNTTLPQGITVVIAKAIAENWLPELIGAVEASPKKNNPLFRAFLAAHPGLDPAKAPPPAPDPLASTFLLANRPFVGRPKLRQCLGQLGAPAQSRVLLIDGARGCGKSYTHSFLEFAATHWQPCRVQYFDLDGQSYTLSLLSQRLQEALALPLPIPQKDQEQDARWAERLASWVVNHTANGQGNLWLVFDGFRMHVHDRGVHDFIDKLGEMIDLTAVARGGHLRLVLINYESFVPEAVAVGAMEERIERPTKEEFARCFVAKLQEKKGTSEDLARAAFEEAYAQALAKAGSDPEGQEATELRYINFAMTRAMKRLTQ